MATVDKKYLDLAGLQKLVQKKAIVVHPTYTETSAAAVKVGTDANGHVKLGTAIVPSDIGAVPTTRKVNNKPLSADVTLGVSDISGAVPNTRTIAGVDLKDNITAAELAQALGISGAMNFIGVSTTDPAGTSGATVTGHTSWKKGDVVIYNRTGETNYEEYIATADDNEHWELLGDADSYALKTVTISAGTGLTGGGDLTQNRTISLATYGTEKTAGIYKVGADAYGRVNIGSAITVSSSGAHTHTVDIAANKVVTTVNTKGYSWSLNKGTDNANVKKVVTGYTAATSKLATTSVTGVSGETTASKATAGTAKNVASAGTAVVYGKADVGEAVANVAIVKDTTTKIGAANVGATKTFVTGLNKTAYHAEYIEDTGTLKLSVISPATDSITGATGASKTISDFVNTASIAPAVSAPSTQTIIPAVANGTITPYTFTDVTVPVAAASATTVATGSLTTSGSGATVATGLNTPSTADVLGSATTITVSNPSTGAQATLAYSGTKSAVTGAGTATEAGEHTHGLA